MLLRPLFQAPVTPSERHPEGVTGAWKSGRSNITRFFLRVPLLLRIKKYITELGLFSLGKIMKLSYL
jgi:hypothetical protein